jgi:hypothetical protein
MIRAFLVSAAILTLAAPASAQDEADRAQARAQFGLGVQRYEAADYQGALEAFQEAYRLAPHPTVYVNLANCYERLNRPLESLAHFERFLEEAENPTRQQRREVETAIARLRAMLGELRLTIVPDGATVTIDGTETRRTPILEPLRLPPGPHTIEVRMAGHLTARREVSLSQGETQRISIRLEPGTDPVPVEDPVVDDPGAGDPVVDPIETDPVIPESNDGGYTFRLTPGVIIAGSTTLAFAVTAIICGSIALSSNAAFEDAVARTMDPTLTNAERDQARADGLAAADTANTTSIVSDIFMIGAIAAAGVTIFFVIVDGLSGEPETETANVRLAPSIGPETGGLVLTGRF